MRHTKVKKRYAKALFDIAEELNIIENIHDDMQFIIEVCKKVPEFNILMKSPIIKSDKKLNILWAILPASTHLVTKKFIEIVTRKNRELFLDAMSLEFIELYKEHHNIQTVYLTTSHKLSEELKTLIKTKISSEIDSKIDLIENMDSDLIGGFIIKVQDKIFDSSFKGGIGKLKKEFSENIYNKAF
ncbi:MAG: ATP synthase F1 subunit delta [Bacteroidales bacterium]|nr:ATP synthase F1 subunit delta [Bacteroidales bacterium]